MLWTRGTVTATLTLVTITCDIDRKRMGISVCMYNIVPLAGNNVNVDCASYKRLESQWGLLTGDYQNNHNDCITLAHKK